jgi:hypothetical protein
MVARFTAGGIRSAPARTTSPLVHAEIQREGRWKYRILIGHTPRDAVTYVSFGRSHTEKRARRLLAKHQLYEVRRSEHWTIEEEK